MQTTVNSRPPLDKSAVQADIIREYCLFRLSHRYYSGQPSGEGGGRTSAGRRYCIITVFGAARARIVSASSILRIVGQDGRADGELSGLCELVEAQGPSDAPSVVRCRSQRFRQHVRQLSEARDTDNVPWRAIHLVMEPAPQPFCLRKEWYLKARQLS